MCQTLLWNARLKRQGLSPSRREGNEERMKLCERELPEVCSFFPLRFYFSVFLLICITLNTLINVFVIFIMSISVCHLLFDCLIWKYTTLIKQNQLKKMYLSFAHLPQTFHSLSRPGGPPFPSIPIQRPASLPL